MQNLSSIGANFTCSEQYLERNIWAKQGGNSPQCVIILNGMRTDLKELAISRPRSCFDFLAFLE